MIRGLASAKPPGEMSAGGQRAGGTVNGAGREVEEDGKAGGLRGGRSIAEESGGERREGESGGDGNGKAAGGRHEQVAGGETVDGIKKIERKYERRLTVCVEQCGDVIPIGELMKAMAVVCGEIRACRVLALGKLEVTVCGERGKDRLLDGFKIHNTRITARELCNDELVVSFLTLPAYTSDDEILDKLSGWGVRAISSIKRRMWPGTNIADGTRIVRVKFNELVQSLPYSTKFNTATGVEYFRVIHDRQMKVCRSCMQPGHILRECPDFTCHNCGCQGHYARECATGVVKCLTCRRRERDCICPVEKEAEEDGGELDGSEPGAPDDGGGEDEEEGMGASMDRDGASGGEEFPTLLEEELTSGQPADLRGERSEGLPRRKGDRSARGRGERREGVRMFGDGTGKTVLKMTWGNDEVGESGDFVDNTGREGSSGSDMDMEELREAKRRLSAGQETEGRGKKNKNC